MVSLGTVYNNHNSNTSYVPMSSKIKLSTATKPRDWAILLYVIDK